jgi:hypothetical protein
MGHFFNILWVCQLQQWENMWHCFYMGYSNCTPSSCMVNTVCLLILCIRHCMELVIVGCAVFCLKVCFTSAIYDWTEQCLIQSSDNKFHLNPLNRFPRGVAALSFPLSVLWYVQRPYKAWLWLNTSRGNQK